MARITCAISGLRFNVSHVDSLTLPHTVGYFHPIFACTQEHLYTLYSHHCKGNLPPNDSYLLFIALLHSSGQINWKVPASLKVNEKNTSQLIENNIGQLVSILEQSHCIKHPAFKQPSFIVNVDNSKLSQIPNWILAWQENIDNFKAGRISFKEEQELLRVENKLSYLILSGQPPEKFSGIIADWACKAAIFPEHRADEWKKVIKSCFSITKMFNTPLPLLKEIKDYCECNIEVGSIHFHTLTQVLREGIFRHTDYLGGSKLALGYELLPNLSLEDINKYKEGMIKEAETLEKIIDNAPLEIPIKSQYTSTGEYVKAKLAYRLAMRSLTENK